MVKATIVPDKICVICGKHFNRRKHPCGRLENLPRYNLRKTCSQACANTRLEPTDRTTFHVRARQLKGSKCEQCGTIENLDVHHRDENIKNNSPENLQTLCHMCHMKLHWKKRKMETVFNGK